MSGPSHPVHTELPGSGNAGGADPHAARAANRDSSILVGHDALGNVLVTGDHNVVQVKLTVVVADTRLRAADVSAWENPYRGLDAFRETDTTLFFGREDLVRRLWIRFHALQREQAPRLLPILGATGSGKSSLVRAGLLPEIVRQPMEGMRDPKVLVLRPGTNPLQRLADVLARLMPETGHSAAHARAAPQDVDMLHRAAQSLGEVDTRVVVFVDQLEELFTECTSETMRSAFLATLAHAAEQPDGIVTVVFAMRNDFVSSLAVHDAFGAVVRTQPFSVSQMSKEQLIEAIVQPAHVLGHPWPTGLAESLVQQCEGRVGALPLLQFALKKLWPEHLAGRLGEGRSSQLIEDFLVQTADELVAGPQAGKDPAARKRILQRAFVAMVQLGEGTPDTRRVARLSEIVARGETEEQVRAVIAPFVAPEARLVTASELDGEPTYELAHEALIGAWDRLRAWLGHVPNQTEAEAIRGALRLRRRLRYSAEAWRVNQGALMRPPELGLVEELRQRQPEEMSAREHEFVDASVEAWEAHDRWRRRARVLGLCALVLTVIAALVAFLQSIEARRGEEEAERQKDEATRNARTARERLAASELEQGRALLLTGHPMRALPHFLAAREEGIESPVLRMLFARVSNAAPLVTLEHRAKATAAAFSPDGARVVTASEDGTVRVWDAHTGKPIIDPFAHRGSVTAVAFSPDGARVVTASDDHTAQVWDARTGKRITDPLAHRGSVTAAAFSPDSARVVTASTDGTAQVWDASSGKSITAPLEHRGKVTTVAFSPDGARVVTASDDHTAQVWDARTGKPVTAPLEHRASVTAAAFSPDGAHVVTASGDGSARVWDGRTGKPVTDPLEHRATVTVAAFSPDSARVITASEDGTARVWNARIGQPVTDSLEHRAKVTTAAFSPDGVRVITASEDGTVRIWDARAGKLVTDPLEHRATVTSAAFSRDGARVVTASTDGTVRVWNASARTPVTATLAHRAPVNAAAFSRDGARVVTASDDGTARVWDAHTGKPVTDPLEHRATVTSAAFSRDGASVVTASESDTWVWDIPTGKLVAGPLKHRATVTAVAFSPDGARVITASEDGTARVWDARTGTLVTNALTHGATVTAAAFSPDGAHAVTASADGTARVWDARTAKPVTEPIKHGATVTAAAFSPDGGHVVTASEDGTARVWDARTGRPATAAMVHRSPLWAAAFGPDGTRVITACWDWTARVWDVRTGKPVTDPLAHRGPVTAAVFSPDGARVVTASWDGAARVWDARTGKPVTDLLAHRAPITAAAFSPDGTRVVTASADGTARIRAIPMDSGTVQDWRHRARCGPFALDNGVLVESHGPCP